METIRLVIQIVISILMQISFIPLRIIVKVVSILESVLSIVRKTLSYLMDEIRYEVLNEKQKTDYAKGNAKQGQSKSS